MSLPAILSTIASTIARAPRLLMIGLIRVYQLAISPMLGPTCRFSPSCSHYACACLRDHGLVRGSWLTIRRLSRCHPWHPGGYDPPPALDAEAREEPS